MAKFVRFDGVDDSVHSITPIEASRFVIDTRVIGVAEGFYGDIVSGTANWNFFYLSINPAGELESDGIDIVKIDGQIFDPMVPGPIITVEDIIGKRITIECEFFDDYTIVDDFNLMLFTEGDLYDVKAFSNAYDDNELVMHWDFSTVEVDAYGVMDMVGWYDGSFYGRPTPMEEDDEDGGDGGVDISWEYDIKQSYYAGRLSIVDMSQKIHSTRLFSSDMRQNVYANRTTNADALMAIYRDLVANLDTKQAFYAASTGVYDMAQKYFATHSGSFDTTITIYADRVSTFDMQHILFDDAIVRISHFDMLVRYHKETGAAWDMKQVIHADRISAYDMLQILFDDVVIRISNHDVLVRYFRDIVSSRDMVQSYYIGRQSVQDTKQIVYADRFRNYDSKQVIYRDMFALFDQLIIMFDNAISRISNFDMKIAHYNDASRDYDVQQLFYKITATLVDMLQIIRRDIVLDVDTKQKIYAEIKNLISMLQKIYAARTVVHDMLLRLRDDLFDIIGTIRLKGRRALYVDLQAKQNLVVHLRGAINMTMENEDFEMYAGDTHIIQAPVVDMEQLTGARLVWALKKSKYTDDHILVKDGTDITINGNEVQIKLNEDDTKDLKGDFYHGCKLYDNQNHGNTIFAGNVTIKRKVTP